MGAGHEARPRGRKAGRQERVEERRQPELRHEHAADEQRLRHRDVAQRRVGRPARPKVARRGPFSCRFSAPRCAGRLRQAHVLAPPAPPRRAAARRTDVGAARARASGPAYGATACGAARTPPAPISDSSAGVHLRRLAPAASCAAPPNRRAAAARTPAAGTSNTARCRSATAASRSAAVVAAAGRRGHAIDHFLLQHQVLVDHVRRRRQQVKQDRRRDVVGQVADHAQRLRQPGAPAPRSRRSARRLASDPRRARPANAPRGRDRVRSASVSHRCARSGSVSAPRPGPISTSTFAGARVDRIARSHRSRPNRPGSAGRNVCARRASLRSGARTQRRARAPAPAAAHCGGSRIST